MKQLLLGIQFIFLSCGFSTYYSQHGQDKFVHQTYFPDKKNGVFIDIGAYDGIKLSNTYFFEKELQWTGVCIEPIPSVFEKLAQNRTCVCIQGCIGSKKGTRDFLHIKGYSEMLSGLIHNYSKEHKKRIGDELTTSRNTKELLRVKCYLLNEILTERNIEHIDFLSVDTEGGEYDIIKSIDFDRVSIDVIAVEDNYDDKRFSKLLSQHGFKCVKTLESDLIFAHDRAIKAYSFEK